MIFIVSRIHIQWNLSKMDTIGTKPCVHYMEGVLYSEVFRLLMYISAFDFIRKGTVEVTGTAVNCDAGYGMEIPCKYRFYSTKDYMH